MADPYTKTHFPFSKLNSQNRPNAKVSPSQTSSSDLSYFALFLLVLINQTILTKFWELIHLFIDIIVSYILFSQRNVQMGIKKLTQILIIHCLMCLGRCMSHWFSKMGLKNENPCGNDEKRVIFKDWNS